MGKIKECFVLRQSRTPLPKIKRGDLFRVCYEEEKQDKYSDWQVALKDATEEEGEIRLQAETVYFVMGRPEIVDVTLRRSEVDIKKNAPTPVKETKA